MNLNVEQFLSLPDTEKPRFLCLPNPGASHKVAFRAGPTLFCSRCGAMPEKTLGVMGEDDSLCYPCYRLANMTSTFKKE